MTDTAALPVVAPPRTDRDGLNEQTARVPARSAVWRWLIRHRWPIVCVICYFVLAVIAYLPVGPFDARQLPIAGPNNPAGADPFQMTWFLSWTPFAISHGISPYHTNYIDFPTGVNLADNTTVPLLGILGWPITATLGPVATFNVLIRLAFALSATSMFFVMRRWCGSFAAPFLAGLLYAFGPYNAGQKLHLDLTFIPLLPVLVLLFDELIRRQRMRPARLGILIGFVSAMQYFVSQEVLSGWFAIVALAAIGLGVGFRHELRERLPYVLRALAFGAIVFAILTGYPLYELLNGPGHLHGPVVTLSALQEISSDLLSPVLPSSNQFFTTGFLSHVGNELVNGNLSENSGYLGVPLLILIVAIVRRLRKDATVMTLVGLAVCAFVLSLGSRLVIGTWRSPIPLPEELFTHVPFLQSTVPARYALFVLLFLSMAVAIGIDRLWLAPRRSRLVRLSGTQDPMSRQRGTTALRTLFDGANDTHGATERRSDHVRRSWSRRHAPPLWAGVAGAIVVVSLLPNAPFASKGLIWPASLTRAIARVVKPGSVVLTYPFPDPNVANMQPMAWQAIDNMGFRLIGGYANIEVPGQSVGQRWPLVVRPHSVQTILGYTSSGDRFPNPPTPTPAIESQLRPFLDKYSIGAVVAWVGLGNPSPNLVQPGGIYAYASRWSNANGRAANLVGPSGVYSYLRRVLGNPQVEKKSYAIWLPVNGTWTASRT